ncbi:MAG TPA: glycosyltransferase family 4 protein [Candidatus Omnitrophota bacterium]|nr:glycosyltransferase family 4 protein [Candidatus Omnitrophota bacterium]HPT39212.1 glycosyltransferase family 4 protein [Candidatus Omnitrophota bacterium]
MSKINLLYIITKLELGGAQKQLLSLISALDKDRYNIFLFTAGDGLLIPEALAIEGLILKRSKFLERVINPLKDILALLEIYFFIKKNRIQIVHTHSSKAGILGRLAAKFAKTPVIIHTVHGWSFNDYQFRPVNYLYRFLERICATFTSKIIVVSSFDQAKGLRNSIASKERYILIRYGLDDKAFSATSKRREIRQSLGLSDMALVVGMVACFKFQKAPLDFIELAGRIKIKFPDVKFVLVGDGRLRGKIVTRIKQLNLENQIILTGWYKDIPGILSGWDIFVLTSLWEGLPISVLEAMSAGLPAVVTDTGGIREALINGQTGYLVDPHDIVFMQNRVEELLNSAQKRDEFGRSSQEIISRGEFSLSSMFKNTAELYSNLSGESKNA